MFFSRSQAVSLAITLREDDEGLKARFHKPESIFSHRCRRHHHASRCFLGFSLKLNIHNQTNSLSFLLLKFNVQNFKVKIAG